MLLLLLFPCGYPSGIVTSCVTWVNLQEHLVTFPCQLPRRAKRAAVVKDGASCEDAQSAFTLFCPLS